MSVADARLLDPGADAGCAAARMRKAPLMETEEACSKFDSSFTGSDFATISRVYQVISGTDIATSRSTPPSRAVASQIRTRLERKCFLSRCRVPVRCEPAAAFPVLRQCMELPGVQSVRQEARA
eukprot:2098646-Rhodomonas_salina.3